MLFMVEMTVSIPIGYDTDEADRIKARERDYAQALQTSGEWRHLWRVAGQYANVSIFDVESVQRLHDILTGLPLYPFMTMTITPLCRHPSSIHEGDA